MDLPCPDVEDEDTANGGRALAGETPQRSVVGALGQARPISPGRG